MKQNRREFLGTAALVGSASSFANSLCAQNSAASFKPIVVSSANGLKATARAMEHILAGADALDSVIAGVNLVEDDPNDMTVGYGGLPNDEGVVELDSCVMHGPTGRGGGVASLQNIKNPSRVAKVVMERTDHVLMVGEGALRFARAHGFKEENLLTERAREAWLSWKESLSNRDDWLPPHDSTARNISGLPKGYQREYGTINCNAMDLKGGLSGCTTTSGLAFKIPGRVGDSPILGAGLYVDNEIGAAGSTGRGEANLLSCSSVMVVEYMRDGLSPEAACLKACERIATQTKMQRLLDDRDRPNFNVKFYAINRRGEFGSGSIWNGSEMAVNTGEKVSRLVSSAYLYKKD
jgi:N4-(beta-N-acetylglucosaminyl)-L-asparaginase